jgi:hypothetical protein
MNLHRHRPVRNTVRQSATALTSSAITPVAKRFNSLDTAVADVESMLRHDDQVAQTKARMAAESKQKWSLSLTKHHSSRMPGRRERTPHGEATGEAGAEADGGDIEESTARPRL